MSNFTYFFGIGGTSVVDYLIGHPDSLHNSMSNFSMGNKQPDLNHCPLFFNIGHSIGSKLTTPSSQGQVLCPNHKKANQYVLNVKTWLLCLVRHTLH
jgi:hypothetical protein